MNSDLGQVLTGKIADSNDQFYFIQARGVTWALSKSEGQYQKGDEVSGFSYVDKQNRPRFTQRSIKSSQTQYGWGQVTGVRKDLGVFVDIGLPDKEVVVSLDNLPDIKELWPKSGDQLYVKLLVDSKSRIWALPAEAEVFASLAKKAYDNMQNQNLRAIVYRLKITGTFVYLPDNNMLGFIHPSERFSEPRLGQELSVRVIGFREADRTLNLSLKPRAHEMLDADAQMILTYLESVGGFMTLNDKSQPEAIKSQFGISKGQFKKALGVLMKQGKIKQDIDGSRLTGEANT